MESGLLLGLCRRIRIRHERHANVVEEPVPVQFHPTALHAFHQAEADQQQHHPAQHAHLSQPHAR